VCPVVPRERLYFATGFGLIQCVKALMSYEDDVRFFDVPLIAFTNYLVPLTGPSICYGPHQTRKYGRERTP